MTQSLMRLMAIIAFGSFGTIAVHPLAIIARSAGAWSGSLVATGFLLVCVATIATAAFYYALKKLVPFIDASALAQARFLDTLNAKYADAAILFSAALSLLLELCIIRWQSSILPFFAFYKNFSLLACFVYSPYQLLEIGRSEDTGLTLIRAAGHYYQNVYDFSDAGSTRWSKARGYYNFPYKAHPTLANVAIVGAGTGNDVAAALRSGAEHVEAIEIDPVIQLTGKLSHPEKPYNDARVHAVVNDARSFLRTTEQKFDLVVYGMLDSHTLLSQGSSVRLDSFVYTVEGLREARARLKPDGMLSLSFSVLSDALGRKIYLMLQQAFDGRPPICLEAGFGGSIIFLESDNEKWVISPQLVEEAGFTDKTAFYADPALHADVSTDDWPFFYMPQRIYPVSYLIMVFQLLALSLLIAVNFLPERPKFSHLSFFFLGAGFMLIETKGITEMGLTFGNTWQVIGIVIAGILTMAFLGNCAVQWLNIRRPLTPYLFLFAALSVGWYIARAGGFASTPLGRLETCIVLTLPLLFSGIVFSTLLSSKGRVSGMMAMNLLGAVCGGLLEYNSMYFGFRFLYLIAIGCYLLAFVSELAFPRKDTDELPVVWSGRAMNAAR